MSTKTNQFVSGERTYILILYWPGSKLYMQYLLNKFLCKVKFIIFLRDSYYPPLNPGGLFILKTFGWRVGRGLIRTGDLTGTFLRRGLSTLAKMVVSVFHKELEYKVKTSSTRSWRSCSRGSNTYPNLPTRESTIPDHLNEVLQWCFINRLYHLLGKNI